MRGIRKAENFGHHRPANVQTRDVEISVRFEGFSFNKSSWNKKGQIFWNRNRGFGFFQIGIMIRNSFRKPSKQINI